MTPDELATNAAPLPRATWSARPPADPWCPPQWTGHLQALAPTFVAPEGAGAADTAVAFSEARTDASDGAEWQLVAVSRRGRLHAHRAEHREDAAAMRSLPSGWCAAVADGAGSAPYSRIGASLAAHASTAAYESAIGRGVALQGALAEGATAAQAALRDFAARADTPPRSLRTTLLIAACHDRTLGVLHVGDGGIAFLHGDGRVVIPTAGHAGEFSGEVAHFLPDDGALEALLASARTAPAHDVAGVILATDGIEDPWYPMLRTSSSLFTQFVHGVTDANADAGGVTQPMRGPVLEAAAPAEAVAGWLRFEKRGENDDRTIFVARQRGVAWPTSP